MQMNKPHQQLSSSLSYELRASALTGFGVAQKQRACGDVTPRDTLTSSRVLDSPSLSDI